MKAALTTLLAIITTASYSQNLIFTNVVQADSLNKHDLYINAKEWFVNTFNSAKDVIQMDSESDGKIIGKGNFKFQGKAFTSGTKSSGPVDFTIIVEIKDGRYKYTLTDFHHSFFGYVPQEEPKGIGKVGNRDLWKDCNKEAIDIISSLQSSMIKKAEDW